MCWGATVRGLQLYLLLGWVHWDLHVLAIILQLSPLIAKLPVSCMLLVAAQKG